MNLKLPPYLATRKVVPAQDFVGFCSGLPLPGRRGRALLWERSETPPRDAPECSLPPFPRPASPTRVFCFPRARIHNDKPRMQSRANFRKRGPFRRRLQRNAKHRGICYSEPRLDSVSLHASLRRCRKKEVARSLLSLRWDIEKRSVPSALWFPEELPIMQFRWIAAITLWTIVSGPVFAPPRSAPPSLRDQSLAAAPRHQRATHTTEAPPPTERPD